MTDTAPRADIRTLDVMPSGALNIREHAELRAIAHGFQLNVLNGVLVIEHGTDDPDLCSAAHSIGAFLEAELVPMLQNLASALQEAE